MGKTTRWFKALFGIKYSSKHPIPRKNDSSGAGLTPATVACLKSYHPQAKNNLEETDQNKHAIAVVAAAVTAAYAAAEVVRLTRRSREKLLTKNDVNWAAVRIQTNFRSYLARKALRALKGVVKIQALMRGYLVRKQATATLHGIEALFRAQVTVHSKRASYGLNTGPVRPSSLHSARPSLSSRRLSASFEPPIDEDNPKVVEVDMGQPRSKVGRIGPGPKSSISELGEGPSYQMLNFQSLSGLQPGWRRQQQQVYHPNYMANTMSFKAKVRSQSAPKQRPEIISNGKKNSVSDRKRMPLKEIIIKERRNSLSEPISKNSAIIFKNVVIGVHLARDVNVYEMRVMNDDDGYVGLTFQALHAMP